MQIAAEHQAFESLPLLVATIDGERVLYINPALASLLGPSPAELVGVSISEMIHRFSPDEQEWLEPLFKPPAQLPDNRWVRVRTQDGRERRFCLRFSPGPRQGEQTVVMLDAEGEATLYRLSEALSSAASELWRCRDEQAVLDLATQAVQQQGYWAAIIALKSDHFVYASLRHPPEPTATAERIYGQPVQGLCIPLGMAPHLRKILEGGQAHFHTDFLKVREEMLSPELMQYMRQNFSQLRGLDAPLFLNEKPFGVLAVQGQNLTPASAATLVLFAKQVEGALENVRHHHQAAARMVQLSHLQAELVSKERLAVLVEAASVVAHEVRNPLGAILNSVAVLKRDPGPPNAVRSGAMLMLEEEVLRLDTVVRDLLNVVRPLEPRPRLLALEELAQRILTSFEERCGSAGVTLLLETDEALPLLEADEHLLQLALENLVRNAVQASPSGGTVRLQIRVQPQRMVLTVEDEGPGVAKVDEARVFEPFFTTRTTGTGLGLAVVKRVVEAHGGSVRAGQRKEGGARFELVLPLPGMS